MASNKKLQVFISSTYIDMIEERQAIVEAILDAGHIPAGMELFKSNDQSQFEIIKRWIDESDVFVLIIGGRYGTVDEESAKSYTELEYDYAVQKEKSRFTIRIDDNYLERKLAKLLSKGMKSSDIKEDKNVEKFNQFKVKVSTKHITFYDSIDKLQNKLISHLNHIERTEPNLIGWVRGDMARSLESAEEMVRLMKENEELKSRIKHLENYDILTEVYKYVISVKYILLNTEKEKRFEMGLNDYLVTLKEIFFKSTSETSIRKLTASFFVSCIRNEEGTSEFKILNHDMLFSEMRDEFIRMGIVYIDRDTTEGVIWKFTKLGQQLLVKLSNSKPTEYVSL